VDEYQDTNDLQTELVSLLHAPSRNHLFIVGDPRQSIYRFRGANVACFKKMLDRLEHLGGKIISLNENFRSRSSIINFVNEVAAPLGGDPLAAERPEVDPAVFALSIPSPEKTPYEELRREEAATIAAHLKGLFDRKAFVWKDMAILFQAMTTTDLYEQALRAFGIPFRTYGGKRFLDRPEIRDLLSALSFAADPSNTSSLLAILRSPLVGLSDDECVLLAGEKGKDFHKAALSSPRASFIQELLRVKEHLHPSELVRFILKETGYEVICQAIDPAGGKVANLEKFIGLACDLEREIQVTLPAFVEFIQNLIRRGARMGDAPVIDDLNSEVKIMTVHAAKGLEFPVVVLPDLIRQPSNATEPWCFVRGRGVSFKQRDPKFPFAPLVAPETFTELRKQDECEEEAESRRLLYVAMTRARDHLVLPIHPEHPTKGRWHRWITPHLEKVETITVNEVKGLTPERRLGGGASPELAEGLGEGFPLPRLSPKSGLVPSRSNTVTVSQLESFDRCPQEYYLKYQLLLPSGVLLAKHPERLSAPVKGSILHNALLMLAKNKTAHVHDLIAAECQALGISCDDATIHELAAPLQSFMKSPLFDDFHQGQHELRFDAIVEDRLITGKIDWLRQGKTGYEIVDFKTDRIDGGCEERAKNYELQMTTYALAIEMALGVSIERTILYFLHPQKTFEMAMSDGRRDEGRKKIAAILNRIAAKDFHLNSFTPPCVHPKTTCTYHINKLCWLDRQQ
ncbi:MAG: PD-(D/E)XK nuclease family protein, partial [Deltaproteobacteria bacterium]|nr:PD-(D/E)XK nuclease family protein [Deltaproteobacteria bacterium]